MIVRFLVLGSVTYFLRAVPDRLALFTAEVSIFSKSSGKNIQCYIAEMSSLPLAVLSDSASTSF